ncbi:hypothetical protein F4680DRAFT_127834 [Xylaria scruposa]|nr:hypothetical protein F4680DRAFT_127834 [Xylaria scruposa]
MPTSSPVSLETIVNVVFGILACLISICGVVATIRVGRKHRYQRPDLECMYSLHFLSTMSLQRALESHKLRGYSFRMQPVLLSDTNTPFTSYGKRLFSLLVATATARYHLRAWVMAGTTFASEHAGLTEAKIWNIHSGRSVLTWLRFRL